MKKKVLIVGGTGFLGRKVSVRLADCYDVIVASHSISGDGIVTYSSVDNLLEQLYQYEIFAIVNCAVLYDRLNKGGDEVEQVNLSLPLELARYAQSTGVSLFLSCDSFYRRFIFGVSANNYVQHKKLLYKQLKGMARNSETKIVVAVIHHMFGAGDSPEKIVNKLVETLKNSGSLTLSACQQNRYFVDVDYVVEIVNEILVESERLHLFSEIDIAGNYYLSTKDFLRKVSGMINSGNIYFDESMILPIDRNIVYKKPLPKWFSSHQKDLEDSLKQLI